MTDPRVLLDEIQARLDDYQDDGLSVRLAFDDRRELLVALRAVLDLLDADGGPPLYIPDVQRAITDALAGQS